MLWWTIKQLKSKRTDVRRKAAETLRSQPNQKAIGHLRLALFDPDSFVRKQACETLAALGWSPSRSDDLVEAALNLDSASGRLHGLRALEALEGLKWKPSQPDLRARYAVAQGRYEDVTREGAVGVAALLEAYNGACKLHDKKIAQILARIPDPNVISSLISAFPDQDASDALVCIGPDSVPFLIGALRNKSAVVRNSVAATLAGIKNWGDAFVASKGTKDLLTALTDEDSRVRESIARALLQCPCSACAEGLLRCATTDPIDAVRASAIQTLSRFVELKIIGLDGLLLAKAKSLEVTIKMNAEIVRSKHSDVRAVYAAVKALARTHSEDAIAPLADLLDRDALAAAEGLGEIGIPGGLAPLYAAMKRLYKEPIDSRRYAAEALSAALCQLLRTSADGVTTEQLEDVAALDDMPYWIRRPSDDLVEEEGEVRFSNLRETAERELIRRKGPEIYRRHEP